MTQARRGGIESLTRLGDVDAYGNATQLGDREWSNEDSGNPGDMVEFVRNVLGDPNILFIIERNLNRNVCYYQLDPETNTVFPAWLMIPPELDIEDMSIDEVDNELSEEGLSMLEKRAYGVDHIDATHFTMRALKGEVFTIHRDAGGARASIKIEGKQWVVRRFMIHTKPSRVFGIPTVAEIHIEVEDGKKIVQFFFAV